MVRSGEISARELVQESLDRIDALDPELNAFVDVFGEDALAEADGIGAGDDRPFAGVPIAIKNNRAIEGRRLTMAADFMGDFVAPFTDNVVRRLREAGFVIVGATSLPEYGILPCTRPRRFGITPQPVRPRAHPGRLLRRLGGGRRVGHGPDRPTPTTAAGSTRIPAACTGLVGLKPQRGRISTAPVGGGEFLVQDGVLTRTVRETAAVLDLLAGYEVGDPLWAPDPASPSRRRPPGTPVRLRIALTTASPLEDGAIDDEARRSVRGHGRAARRARPRRRRGRPAVEQPRRPAPVHGVLRPAGLLERRVRRDARGPARDRGRHGGAELGDLPALPRRDRLGRRRWPRCSSRPSAARSWRGWASTTCWSRRRRSPEPPVTHDVLDPTGPDPMGTFARSGVFTPFTALFQRQRPAGDHDPAAAP